MKLSQNRKKKHLKRSKMMRVFMSIIIFIGISKNIKIIVIGRHDDRIRRFNPKNLSQKQLHIFFSDDIR